MAKFNVGDKVVHIGDGEAIVLKVEPRTHGDDDYVIQFTSDKSTMLASDWELTLSNDVPMAIN